MKLNLKQINYELDNNISNSELLEYSNNYYINKKTISEYNTDMVADINSAVSYYKKYARAMHRRRDYTLEIHSFVQLCTNEGWGDHRCYFYKDSMVHGFFKEYMNKTYFCISHFCPSSLREGVEMIKYLLKYDNVVFAVTDDLSVMLEKIGYQYITSIPQEFDGELTMKEVYLS